MGGAQKQKGKGKGKKVVVDEGSTTMEDFSDGDFGFDPQSRIPLGCRFQPTDQLLVGFYLPKKAAGTVPPYHDFIPTVDLYVPGADPWILHPAAAISPSSFASFASTGGDFFLPAHWGDWFYFYTHTTPSGSGECRKAGSGTWHANGKLTAVSGASGQTLGYKTSFAFKLPGGTKGVSTGWVMHEFRRKSGGVNGKDLVLCRIRCTQGQAGEEEAPTCKRQRTTGPQELGESGLSLACAQAQYQLGESAPVASPTTPLQAISGHLTGPRLSSPGDCSDPHPLHLGADGPSGRDIDLGNIDMDSVVIDEDENRKPLLVPKKKQQEQTFSVGIVGSGGGAANNITSLAETAALESTPSAPCHISSLDALLSSPVEVITLPSATGEDPPGYMHSVMVPKTGAANTISTLGGTTAMAMESAPSAPCHISSSDALPSSPEEVITLPSAVGEEPSWCMDSIVDLWFEGIEQDEHGKFTMANEEELQRRENTSLCGWSQEALGQWMLPLPLSETPTHPAEGEYTLVDPHPEDLFSFYY